LILDLLDCVEDELAEPLLPDRSVVSLDIGVLLRISRLDVEDADAALLRPGLQFPTDVFGAIWGSGHGIHLLEPPVFLGHRVGYDCLRLISDSIAASNPPYLLRQL